MISAEQYNSMTAGQIRERMDELASSYFDRKSWKTEFANATGLNRVTVQNWFGSRNPPLWAMQWLDLALKAKRLEQIERLIAGKKL